MNKDKLIYEIRNIKNSVSSLNAQCDKLLRTLDVVDNVPSELYVSLDEYWEYLSVRTRNALSSYSIFLLGDLVVCNEKTISNIDGIGSKSLNEIKYLMRELNLILGSTVSSWVNAFQKRVRH